MLCSFKIESLSWLQHLITKHSSLLYDTHKCLSLLFIRIKIINGFMKQFYNIYKLITTFNYHNN